MEAKSLLLPPRYTPPSRYSHEVTADQAIILPFNFLGSGFCAFMAEEPVTYQINPLFQFSCVLEKAVLALISETAGTYRRVHDDDLPAPAPAPAMERKVFLKEETPASPAFPSCLLNNFSVYKQHPRIFDLTPTASVASSIEAPKSPAWSSSRGLNRSRQSVRGCKLIIINKNAD